MLNFQSVKVGFRVFAVFGEEGAIERKSGWQTLFDVEDPRTKVPQSKGKFLDANQALEVARNDIQYCDWRARQDVLTIMHLHEKVPSISCYFICLFLTFFSFHTSMVPFCHPPRTSFSWFIFHQIAFRLMKLCNLLIHLLETCFMLKICCLNTGLGCGSPKSSSPELQVYWNNEKGAC